MVSSYQLFELDESVALVATKDRENELLEFSSEEEALKAVEYSIELKEYIVLKKISRDTNIADDIKDMGIDVYK